MCVIRPRKLHELQAFDDFCYSTCPTPELFVFCTLPAAEVFVKLPINGEGKTIADKFATATICLDEFSRFEVAFTANDKEFYKRKKKEIC